AFAFRKPGMSMWLALVLAGWQAVGVVVAEDQLQVRVAQASHELGLGLDLHALGGALRAADGRVLLAFDLHDAHPAGAESRQLGFVAQRRDLDAVVAADLEDGLAGSTFDEAPVDLEADGRGRG